MLRDHKDELIHQLRRIVYRLDDIRLILGRGTREDQAALDALADTVDADNAALAQAVADNTPGA